LRYTTNRGSNSGKKLEDVQSLSAMRAPTDTPP
jgi:hypothetical protein